MFDVQSDVEFWIIQKSQEHQIDHKLALAIAHSESNLNPYVIRYEPKWAYFMMPDRFSVQLFITENTEKVLQSISWGPLQVMGAVCRELGYTDHLTKLGYDYQSSIECGINKLQLLLKKYSKIEDVISSYNQGTPIKTVKGLYKNQNYVDNVMRWYGSLK